MNQKKSNIELCIGCKRGLQAVGGSDFCNACVESGLDKRPVFQYNGRRIVGSNECTIHVMEIGERWVSFEKCSHLTFRDEDKFLDVFIEQVDGLYKFQHIRMKSIFKIVYNETAQRVN